MATQEGKYETGNAVRDTILHDQTGKMLRLYQEREKNRIAIEKAKEEVTEETAQKRKFATIDNKFGGSAADVFEEEFRNSTVGLVSVEEFRAKRKRVDELVQKSLKAPEEPKRKVIQKTCSAKLSFGDDEEEEEEEEFEVPRTLGFLGKNPYVNTSFLPDEARTRALEQKKAELTAQWMEDQERIRNEEILITFSYYDGSGHRRDTTLPKGTTIEKFLVKVQNILERDFPDMRTRNPGSLLYVKEDLIIPARLTFYDLIKSEARGPHGPLFDYDDGEERDPDDPKPKGGNERHAGKVVCSRWYERNKHVFPASSWEHYDPNKKYERSVSIIIDKEKYKKK